MRITNKLMVKGYLSDLTANLENMRKYQEQLSSGKEIRRPSDDPFKVARTMELKTSIALNERYKTNIEEGIGWTETTDEALGQMGNVLQRVRELTVAGGNGSYSESEKYAIKEELEQLKESLAHIGNTVYDGRYVFGGDKTTEPPFEIKSNGEIIYKGSADGLNREFSPGVVIDVAVSGDKMSNAPAANEGDPVAEGGIFKVMTSIISDLGSNKSPGGNLDELDNQIDNLLKLRAEVGANSNRLDAMKDKNDEETFNMTELLSKTSDIDVAKKVMEYKVMESVYTASLQAGAKIIQPSLIDFLR